MKPNDLDAEADRLSREAEDVDAALSSADLYDAQILAARRAIVEPREKAAISLREAANAIREIPPLGLMIGQGKTA
jgi:hypothetical protein